ncbi:MAG: hypothetical protein L0Y67_07070, partial [Gammaproteobacteria bacterium]|nr:hypothetical protein [Gammaproteobacteria bacterium]
AKETKKQIELSDSTSRYLDGLRKDYSEGLPFHLRYKLQHMDSRRSRSAFLSSIWIDVKEVGRAILIGFTGARESNKSFYRIIGKFQRLRLRRYYQSLTKEVSFGHPYIFVALQCEPERRAFPSGGVFGHQYLMIDLLARHLPKGWRLYVKEHVSQFKSYQHAERARTFAFYDYIASRDGVSLVPLSVNSFQLIDGAKAVATISGTVGWEAVNRGIPAMLFGYSWYRDCEGIFVTNNEHACIDALTRIAEGYHVDRYKILLYAKVLEQKCVKGYIDKVSAKINLIPYQQNVNNIGEAIAAFYSSSRPVKTKLAG